ncbi:hypothetical protein [Bacillus sp. 3255]|uniref:hypothetical protein n=1 Tax=Bacillus sp. 3255 TaxID=2817904 RepID=UPI00286CC0BB|nr:hypothetical protein [Bacillus sp. 3255]
MTFFRVGFSEEKDWAIFIKVQSHFILIFTKIEKATLMISRQVTSIKTLSHQKKAAIIAAFKEMMFLHPTAQSFPPLSNDTTVRCWSS